MTTITAATARVSAQPGAALSKHWTGVEQAGPQGFDLGTIRRAERADQETALQWFAAETRMAPQAALDHHIDLALEQLVQARRLAEANGHLGLRPAKMREARPQAIEVETRMHPDMQQACDALGLEPGGGVGEAGNA